MLSDEQMDHIRQEEIFRQEVRKTLEAEKPPLPLRKKVWTFLNSSFSLWFLSSIVLAFFTWAFTEHQHRVAREAEKTDLRKRLNTEITFRIANGIIQNKVDTQRINAGAHYTPYDMLVIEFNYLNNDVFNRAESPPEQIDYSIYPEYKHRKFRALLRELKTVTTLENVKYIDEAEHEYMTFEKAVDDANIDLDIRKLKRDATPADMDFALQHLLKLERNPIWKTSE